MADITIPKVKIPPAEKESSILGLGCWAFGGDAWGGQQDEDSRQAMEVSFREGINHIDTAQSYGGGRSEQVVGDFIQGCMDRVFVASKVFPNDITKQYVLHQVDASRDHLKVDAIDLYYLHWPRSGQDIRPMMEGMEEARSKGKIRAIGVSNYSVEQMELVSEVGSIDAHQLCYNLLWRFAEDEIIPYCRARGIAVITYSTIAEGILTGKFPLALSFPEGDHRRGTTLFQPETWPLVHETVQQMKQVAEEANRSLHHLAIRWVTRQPDVAVALVGARNQKQAEENAAAMHGDIPAPALERLTQISDEIRPKIPNTGNIFQFYP